MHRRVAVPPESRGKAQPPWEMFPVPRCKRSTLNFRAPGQLILAVASFLADWGNEDNKRAVISHLQLAARLI